MQASFLLIQLSLEQIVVYTRDYLVLNLADITNAKFLTNCIVAEQRVLGCHIDDGDHLKFLELHCFQVKILSFVSVVLRDCIIGEQVESIQML